MLRARLLHEVALDHAVKHYPVTISLSRIEFTDVEINPPAAALGLAVPRPTPLELTGDAMLQVIRLAIARGTVQGNATLQWRAAGSALAPVSPLLRLIAVERGDGSFALQLE